MNRIKLSRECVHLSSLPFISQHTHGTQLTGITYNRVLRENPTARHLNRERIGVSTTSKRYDRLTGEIPYPNHYRGVDYWENYIAYIFTLPILITPRKHKGRMK